jgi:hypothetical protein
MGGRRGFGQPVEANPAPAASRGVCRLDDAMDAGRDWLRAGEGYDEEAGGLQARTRDVTWSLQGGIADPAGALLPR